MPVLRQERCSEQSASSSNRLNSACGGVYERRVCVCVHVCRSAFQKIPKAQKQHPVNPPTATEFPTNSTSGKKGGRRGGGRNSSREKENTSQHLTAPKGFHHHIYLHQAPASPRRSLPPLRSSSEPRSPEPTLWVRFSPRAAPTPHALTSERIYPLL